MERPEKPLSGLTVIEWAGNVAGPYCGKLLAGFGAEVIKVEQPEGDPARRHPPFAGDRPDPERSALFLYLNTGKRSVTLDLTQPAGRELLDDLVRDAAILIEDCRPAELAALGLGYAHWSALNPSLVVADEPVSALDVSVQAQILNLLLELQQELGLTYLFVAHDLSVVKHISDRVAVMYVGKIVEMAHRDQIFNAPKHPYTSALLSAVPRPDPRARSKRLPLAGEVANPAAPPSGCYFHPRCPYALEVCKTDPPAWEEIIPGQWAACHRARELDLPGIAQT